MFIYKIANTVNDKIYVGQHKGDNLQHYLQQKFYEAEHRLKDRSHLYAAIRKYGRDAFFIESLAVVNGDDLKLAKATLDSLEKFCIAFLDSRNPEKGYNICRGGEGFTGPHSPETKAKIADASREMWQRPGTKENFSAKMKGHPVSRKTIDAARRTHLGIKSSPETVEKLRNSHIGLASPRRKLVRCLDTDEVFPSLTAAVAQFGGCTTNLSRAIREGYSFLGRQFEYVNQ